MSALGALASAWLAPPAGSGAEEAAAYTELLLLNVYPYASVFLDAPAELNGPSARWAASRYAASGFTSPVLDGVGAPDHVGVCLEFLASAGHDAEFRSFCLDWIPVFTLVVERDPGTTPYFGSLARKTRHALFQASAGRFATLERYAGPPEDLDAEREVRLSDVVAYLLTPAACGFFLSRARLGRLARKIGLRLPFSSRFDVARNLFASAGEAGRVAELLGELERERKSWTDAYVELSSQTPAWKPFAELWIARAQAAGERLADMQEILARPLELQYGDPTTE